MRTNGAKRIFILNMVIPIAVLLLILSLINIYSDLKQNEAYRLDIQESLNSELRSFVELQYASLHVIEQAMEGDMQRNSEFIVNEINKRSSNPESADLYALREKIGIDTSLCDLYIINRDGIIVNTTFKPDLYFSFANFGQNHILYLYECFRNREFVTPSFFFDSKSERYRKYSYQPTADGRYIVEIGYYSPLADKIYSYVADFMRNRASEIDAVVYINQYAFLERPKSFNLKQQFPKEHYKYLPELKAHGEVTVSQKEEEGDFIYNYLYDSLPYGISNGIIIGIKTKKPVGLGCIDANIMRHIVFDVVFIVIIIMFMVMSMRKWHAKSDMVFNAAKNISEDIPQSKLPISGRGEYPRLVSYFNKIIENTNLLKSENVRLHQQLNFTSHRILELQESLRIQQQMLDTTRVEEKQSLNYAYRIQQALMPDQNDFFDILPKSFIYHKQRLSVGGDFFWHTTINGQTILVVGDCSGSGQTAAFLSIVGITLLNNIIRAQDVVVPALILDKLDSAIKDLFSDDYYYDQISMVVCAINTDDKQLTFSSANMPVVTVANGVTQTHRGCQFSLGMSSGVANVFNNISLGYDEETTFYISTKGYLSQFDASDSKKLNFNNYRKLLTSISGLPMTEQQKSLDSYIDAWRGKTPQTDDILIVGFKCC